MRARDIMTSRTISVGPDLPVKAVANTLIGNNISAVPVVGLDGKLMGIVSEGDLVRRVETGTERTRSWWLEMFVSAQSLAEEFLKSHGLNAKDVMTRQVVVASPDATLQEIADLMETNNVKRVPIVEADGRVVGIVSRANLVQALASGAVDAPVYDADEALRESIVKELDSKPWGAGVVNVIVKDGAVSLWGFVNSAEEKNAIRVAAERAAQGATVNDNIRVYRWSAAG